MRGSPSADPADISEDQTKAVEDARRFGMDEAALADLRVAMGVSSVDDGAGIWPEHIDIVQAFLSVSSQFRVVAIGGGFAASRVLTMGLDYAGVRAGLDGLGINVTPELWNGLLIMEAAAVAALNKGS